jgi:hypothetical protein
LPPMYIRLSTLLILSTVIFSTSSAHEAPSGWKYPQACCAGQDCKPVPCEEIREEDNGYTWNQLFFTKDKVHASHDNECHVCVHKDVSGLGPTRFPVCMFVPTTAYKVPHRRLTSRW